MSQAIHSGDHENDQNKQVQPQTASGRDIPQDRTLDRYFTNAQAPRTIDRNPSHHLDQQTTRAPVAVQMSPAEDHDLRRQMTAAAGNSRGPDSVVDTAQEVSPQRLVTINQRQSYKSYVLTRKNIQKTIVPDIKLNNWRLKANEWKERRWIRAPKAQSLNIPTIIVTRSHSSESEMTNDNPHTTTMTAQNDQLSPPIGNNNVNDRRVYPIFKRLAARQTQNTQHTNTDPSSTLEKDTVIEETPEQSTSVESFHTTSSTDSGDINTQDLDQTLMTLVQLAEGDPMSQNGDPIQYDFEPLPQREKKRKRHNTRDTSPSEQTLNPISTQLREIQTIKETPSTTHSRGYTHTRTVAFQGQTERREDERVNFTNASARDMFRKTRMAFSTEAKSRARAFFILDLLEREECPKWAYGLEPFPSFVPGMEGLDSLLIKTARDNAKNYLRTISNYLIDKADEDLKSGEALNEALRTLCDTEEQIARADVTLRKLSDKDYQGTLSTLEKVEAKILSNKLTDADIWNNVILHRQKPTAASYQRRDTPQMRDNPNRQRGTRPEARGRPQRSNNSNRSRSRSNSRGRKQEKSQDFRRGPQSRGTAYQGGRRPFQPERRNNYNQRPAQNSPEFTLTEREKLIISSIREDNRRQ